MILCRLRLHAWKYLSGTGNSQRRCVRCNLFQSRRYGSRRWRG